MNIHNLITERKSIRSFSPKSISDQEIISLFEAARWAPSSMNEQPWRFILAKKEDPESFQKVLSCLNDSNSNWAKNAAALVITLAHKSFTSIDKPNAHAWHDVGLAVGNISLQAMALNIFMHQMGGFNRDTAKSVFEIPDDYEPVSVIAFGYEGDVNLLPEDLRMRELKARERLPLSELVYTNTFGEKNKLFTPTERN